MITTLPAFVAVETRSRREQLSRAWGAPLRSGRRSGPRPVAPAVCRADGPCPAVAG
ncbi:MAG TPA: hypothetical protein VLO09_05175 [Ornithinimicrobium sp.]|nr:hypothetical protein [Ornithinimicrobium sp.]